MVFDSFEPRTSNQEPNPPSLKLRRVITAFAKATAVNAGVAQLVEHQLPKLRVAGSSLVSRSLN